MKNEVKPSRISFSFASGLGVLGFVLSLVSLGWQVYVHQESLVDKALVRFSISFLNNDKQIISFDKPTKHQFSVTMDAAILKGKNELSAEIINIGQHPLYVKRVRLIVPCPETGDSDSITFEPPKDPHPDGLEPGAAITYKAGPWNFEEHPLGYGSEKFCVTVESNKGFLTQTDQFSYVTFALGKEGKSKLDQTPVSVSK
jgi:hypothetical protein